MTTTIYLHQVLRTDALTADDANFLASTINAYQIHQYPNEGGPCADASSLPFYSVALAIDALKWTLPVLNERTPSPQNTELLLSLERVARIVFAASGLKHEHDEDCTIDPATDCCLFCGVWHADACEDCKQHAFHTDACTADTYSGM